MRLVLERAERVRDPFDGIRQRMREVVHRIDAPRASGAVMLGVADAIEHRVAHVDVRRPHVDLRAQHVGAVGKLAGAHPAEQIAILGDAAPAIRRIDARLGQRAAVLADLVGRERVDIGEALVDQPLGELVELLVIVRRVVLAILPVEAQPPHVVLDRVDVLDVFLDRIGVVEAEIAASAELLGDAEVETDRLGVPDVQVAVGLGRKARDHTAAGDAAATSLATISRMKSVGAAGALVCSSDMRLTDDQIIAICAIRRFADSPRCTGNCADRESANLRIANRRHASVSIRRARRARQDRQDDQGIAPAPDEAVRGPARHDGEAAGGHADFVVTAASARLRRRSRRASRRPTRAGVHPTAHAPATAPPGRGRCSPPCSPCAARAMLMKLRSM